MRKRSESGVSSHFMKRNFYDDQQRYFKRRQRRKQSI